MSAASARKSPRPLRRPVARVRSFHDVQPEVRHVLHEGPPTLVRVFEWAEQQSGVSREHLAYGLLGLLGVYLVIGALAELVCNLIGLVYPAWASVHAIRTEDKEDDTQWLCYWTVFATFSVVDFWAERIMHVFPFYWLLKALFLLFLALPQTRGAAQVYESVVDPAVAAFDAYWEQRAVNTAVPKPAE